MAYNGQGFLLCWYSVIVQPELSLSKVNAVENTFCCSALFVQPGLQLISERDDQYIFQVSGFIYDAKKRGQRTNTERSKKFVTDYLNKVASKPYDKDELIELLRNKLVHNYSLTDRRIPNHRRYQLEYFNPKLHLYAQDDIVFINIDGFVTDLENAFQHYKKNLLNDEALQKNALEHYDNFGILVHREISIHLGNA